MKIKGVLAATGVSTILCIFAATTVLSAPASSDDPTIPTGLVVKIQSSTAPLIRVGSNSFYPIVNDFYVPLPSDVTQYELDINGEAVTLAAQDGHFRILQPIRTTDSLHLNWGGRNLTSAVSLQINGPFNLGNVNFDFNKTDLTPDAKMIIQQMARQIASLDFRGIYLVGNADNVGSDRVNLAISKKRVEKAQAYLQTQLEKLGVLDASFEAQHMANYLAKGKSGVRSEGDRSVTFLLYPSVNV